MEAARTRSQGFPALGVVLLAACTQEYTAVRHKAVLVTDPLVEAGRVAVGDRQSFSIELRSIGAGPVTVRDITIESDEGDEAFVLMDWLPEGATELTLDGGSEDAPSTAMVEVSFRPEDPGYFRGLMTIESNDTEVEDGIWKVALRGVALYPCGAIAPGFLDYGVGASGGYFPGYVEVFNCGQVTLTIAGFEEDSASFQVYTPDPVYVVPGESEIIEVGWEPGSLDADSATISFITNDPNHEHVVQAVGNDCSESANETWDADNDGWFVCGGDCDDTDAQISPEDVERKNGYDDDCDGEIDETTDSVSVDDDNDGYTETEGDCHDGDPTVSPAGIEVIDQVDNDCNGKVDDGTTWYDDDADGFAEREGDCDDDNVLIYPGAQETIDEQDNDCDGDEDEGGLDYDDDGDGYAENEGDCDDADPWSYPLAIEDCDETDNNCDDVVDEDEACAYLVQRDEDTGLDDESPGTCSAAPAAAAAGLLWLASLGLAVRRRRG